MKISIARQDGLKWVASAGIALALSLFSHASTQAGENRTSKEEMRSVYLVKYQVNNTVRYGKNPAGKVRKVKASQYLNRNPYVCTPSGFGRKARCYARDAF